MSDDGKLIWDTETRIEDGVKRTFTKGRETHSCKDCGYKVTLDYLFIVTGEDGDKIYPHTYVECDCGGTCFEE